MQCYAIQCHFSNRYLTDGLVSLFGRTPNTGSLVTGSSDVSYQLVKLREVLRALMVLLLLNLGLSGLGRNRRLMPDLSPCVEILPTYGNGTSATKSTGCRTSTQSLNGKPFISLAPCIVNGTQHSVLCL